MPRSRVVLLVAVVALLLPSAANAATDPLRSQQWHLDALSAGEAWRHTQGRDVVVAVVDTGVEASHPDLEGRVLAGRDFVRPGTPADDENGHGTLVAGLIAAVLDNGIGGAGLAPRSRILPVRVLDADGRGDPADVARGIRWAVDNGAHIVNLSLTETPDALSIGLITTEVERAIRDAREAGVLVVGAAGNEGARSTPYRSSLPVVVVGALDRDDEVWADSNRDRRTLFAPGIEMISTFSGGGYARADGTSFAAPLVSAAAALLVAIEPDIAVGALERRLLDTARPVGAGAGALDLVKAVGAARAAAAGPPAPATSPSPRPSPQRSPAPSPSPAAPGPPDDGGTGPERGQDPPPPADDLDRPSDPDTSPEPVQAVPPEPEVTPVPDPVAEPTAAAEAVEDRGDEDAGTPVASRFEPVTDPGPATADEDPARRWPIPAAAVLLALDVALLGGLLRARGEEPDLP